ncbi:MAG: metallophosphoesterase [Phycisphaerae bacterium]|jgi:3',5'-cyclic AMP phosphodiesterase CpdA
MNRNVRQSSTSRREFLHGAVAVASVAALGRSPAAGAQERQPASVPPPRPAQRKRVLRVAHLTDIHVQPELKAGEGLAECLRHVQAQRDKPDLILTGGDTIMDCFEADEARTRLQWELWKQVLKAECSLPVESCIGNHDVWGWHKARSKTTGSEPGWGKKWAMDMFGIQRPYRSFDRAGWRFVVLDSVFPNGDGYIGKLDDEQFEWLGAELAAVPRGMPVLVLSHIPIFSAAALFDGQREKSGNWDVPASYMHIDARRIKDLFYKHGNVRLALSGHLHLVDRVDYLGTTYLCNGAVCGAWWKGPHYEFSEGYALINLHDDGSFEHEYVTYGWAAPKPG